MPPTAFPGFTPDATRFFTELAANNERAWFEANKARYETAVKAPMSALVDALAEECARRGLPLTGDAKRGLFRIHRDVRFSKDKSPYKTNAGAVLTRDGRKGTPGLLYIHLDPEGCFMAAGFYHAEPDQLARLRDAIAYNPADFTALLDRLAAHKLALGDGEPLSRLPRGYEFAAGTPVEAAVKMRNLIVRRPIKPADLKKPALVGAIADFAAQALPLLEFGWEALS